MSTRSKLRQIWQECVKRRGKISSRSNVKILIGKIKRTKPKTKMCAAFFCFWFHVVIAERLPAVIYVQPVFGFCHVCWRLGGKPIRRLRFLLRTAIGWLARLKTKPCLPRARQRQAESKDEGARTYNENRNKNKGARPPALGD